MKIEEKIIKRLIEEKIKSNQQLSNFKRKISKEFKIPLPCNFWLFKEYQKLLKEKRIKKSKSLEKILKIRPIRSLSGIVNISVLTKPYPCPGVCVFCPTQEGFPKSYLGGEPAAERARILNYHPYFQVKKRIASLKIEGHSTDKIELRIVGGTWSYYPIKYREWFVKKCFEAANGKSSKNLEEAQRKNEKAKNKIVGISIETRPDFINEKEIINLRKMGVTMVEMGVQTVFDNILEKNKTGLNQEIIAKATKLLKDAGFKVLYHLMLNLPGSSPKKDLECFKIIFSDERFKPDWIKIYPVVITKGSKLHKIWKKGKYKPYSEKKLIKLLIEIKRNLPYWIRVARILRDIPAPKIEAGCKISNLREVLKKEMKKKNSFCKCIRCREIREKYNPKEKIYLFREDYYASGGKEIFLSFENKKRTKLYSLLRLRITKDKLPVIPILKDSALIREIQTYGESVPISQRKLAPQHQGLGKKLIKEAEKIIKREFNLKKIVIISGIGAREYFRKLGYQLRESYMIKLFQF